jgi:hypothetical protein
MIAFLMDGGKKNKETKMQIEQAKNKLVNK